MNKCWHSKKIRRTNGVGCIFSILFSALIIGVFLSIDDKTVFFETPLLFVNWIMAFSLAALYLGASFFLYLIYISREYCVAEEYLLLQNFKNKVHKYLWEEVSEISICDIHHASKGYLHEKVIRIVIGEERNGPTNPKCPRKMGSSLERWRSASYSFIHCRNIILIEYSEEKLNQIQCVYKKEIKDYKTDRWNKYNK